MPNSDDTLEHNVVERRRDGGSAAPRRKFTARYIARQQQLHILAAKFAPVTGPGGARARADAAYDFHLYGELLKICVV